jgi:adenylosuccinate lyase
VDGRYRRAVETLADYFSESALIRYRVQVEIEYFIALCQLPLPPLAGIDGRVFTPLRSIYENFGPDEAAAVKAIECETNHDVKAVEYFLKERFEQLGLGAHKEFIHFGLTSQDINNTAVPLSLRDAWTKVLAPLFDEVLAVLAARVNEWKDVPLLARTHGQPASPTVMGKEIQVFVERLQQQRDLLAQVPFSGKFGGATGNFNAHRVAYPAVDWPDFADRLVNDVLGLKRCRVTTQIEHYDNLAAFCDGLKRLNTILIDLDRDIWTYIAMNYFRQKIKEGEVGSSTMPHKVNPIDFENSEGNLGVANALLEHLAAKLPISRLQRDLTDSTVTRNIGVPLAHTVIALKSLLRGMDKLMIDTAAINQDLEANWAVVTEGIQTVLRRVGYPHPYEALKALARTNKPIDQDMIAAFIDGLDVDDDIRAELKRITPHNYTGVPLI